MKQIIALLKYRFSKKSKSHYRTYDKFKQIFKYYENYCSDNALNIFSHKKGILHNHRKYTISTNKKRITKSKFIKEYLVVNFSYKINDLNNYELTDIVIYNEIESIAYVIKGRNYRKLYQSKDLKNLDVPEAIAYLGLLS